MLEFNNSYLGAPFTISPDGDKILIVQEKEGHNQVHIDIGDVEDLIRKLNHTKNEIISAKVREANKELFS